MCDYVNSQIVNIPAAIKITRDILFSTSNRLYDLKLRLEPLESPKPLNQLRDSYTKKDASIEDTGLLRKFLSQEPTVKFLRLQWVDYTATVRLRILPIARALHLLPRGKSVNVTKAVLGLLQTDAISRGFRATGQYQLYPIISSLHIGARPGYAMVQCEFRDDNGQPVPSCPRTFLRRIVERALDHGIEFHVGFEIEVVFMSYETEGGQAKYGSYPVTQGHSWSAARALHDNKIMQVVESIIAQLERSGIGVQQFHPESAPGQYEFVMDPLDPLAAVDSLTYARDIIAVIAAKHALRATFVPKPYPSAAGTGSHIHVSMTPPEPHQQFLAGILKNLPAIEAITYSTIASYERVADSEWSGGKPHSRHLNHSL